MTDRPAGADLVSRLSRLAALAMGLTIALGAGARPTPQPAPDHAEPVGGNADNQSEALLAPPAPSPNAQPTPAGLYFRQGGFSTCGECPEPDTAVILGIVESVSEARALVKAVPPDALPLGYPLVVHTDELGLSRTERGVVVVAGLFESEQSAAAWISDADWAGPPVAVEPLLDGAEARRRIELLYIDRLTEEADSLFVVYIDAPVVVPAYPARDLMQARMGDRGEGIDVTAIEPACEVRTGDLFVASHEDTMFTYYDWAPVRCGDLPAYVEWRYTTIHSTVIPRPDGSFQLHQLVGAECDMPFFQQWKYTRNGRVWEGDELVQREGGCGG